MIKSIFSRYRNFILYILIGFTGLTLDFITFVILTRYLGLHEQIVNPISMSVGITNNFFLNAFFNFKKTDSLFKRYISFYLVGVIGIFISAWFLWFFNDFLGNNVQAILDGALPFLRQYRIEFVKAVSIIVIAIIQFFMNKRISFN